MQRPSLLANVWRLEHLPLPQETVAALLTPLVHGKPRDLGPLLRRDPSLTLVVLRWVGAPRLPRWPTISDLVEAIDPESLADLVGQLLAGPSSRAAAPRVAAPGDGNNTEPAYGPDANDRESVQRHLREAVRDYALRVALAAARQPTEGLSLPPEHAYLAANAQSLGMLALAAALPKEYWKIVADSRSYKDLCEREQWAFGTDHRAITRRLARRWKLPRWASRSNRDSPLDTCIAQAHETSWPILATSELGNGQPKVPPHPVAGLPATRPSAGVARRGAAADLPDPETVRGVVRLIRENRRLRSKNDSHLETEKLEALAEFAAGAGHEINNPLAVIYGRSQLLLVDEKNPERRRALLTIAAQATRIHEMIADVMLFARPPDPDRAALDLVPITEECVESFREIADRQGTALQLRRPSRPITALVDPVQFRVVVFHLVRNSLEALEGDGEVVVSLENEKAACTAEGVRHNGEPEQRFAVLRVVDDGPGISSEVRRHLFDPFYSGRQAGRGLGFGLAKCWRIVRNHGGHIDVNSDSQTGTVFSVRLPAAESRACKVR